MKTTSGEESGRGLVHFLCMQAQTLIDCKKEKVNSRKAAVSAKRREDSLASDSAYLAASGDSTEVGRPTTENN